MGADTPSGGETARWKGLTTAEAEASQERHGRNLLPSRVSWPKLLRAKFEDRAVHILIIAAIVALIIDAIEGQYAEALGIIVALFFATALASLNEFQALTEFESIRAGDDEPITVIRDGVPTELPRHELAVGDIVLLETGDEIPADGQVLEASSLHVNEASLTEEMTPARKMPKEELGLVSLEETTHPPDRVLRGTEVVEGQGTIELTAVGSETELGQLDLAPELDGEADTPLMCQLERLNKLLATLGFLVAAVVFATLIGQSIAGGELSLTPQQWGLGALDEVLSYLLLAVAIIVVAVPEGLAMSVRLSLAYSLREMVASGVVVRHVRAWESMGAVTTICIDDTLQPSEETQAAIQACRQAGIKVKWVTRRALPQAQEAARQIGLLDEHDAPAQCLTAAEFNSLSDQQAQQAAGSLTMLVEAGDAEKRRLVELLRAQGETVAATGDDVGDVAVFESADVGLAMGKTATREAKEASDIVVRDGSPRGILDAVMWGRSLRQNIQRFLLFQLTVNITACGTVLLGPLVGVNLPLTVTQLLWINLIMDSFAALALASEPPQQTALKRPPLGVDEPIITSQMAGKIAGAAVVFLAALLALLIWIQRSGPVTDHQLTVFFTVFVMMHTWNLFNARRLGTNRTALHGLLQNPGFLTIIACVFIGQVAFVHYGGSVFRAVPLSVQDWFVIVLATSSVLWLGEMCRLVGRSSAARRRASLA